jgi:hypothetical protein
LPRIASAGAASGWVSNLRGISTFISALSFSVRFVRWRLSAWASCSATSLRHLAPVVLELRKWSRIAADLTQERTRLSDAVDGSHFQHRNVPTSDRI